MVTTPPHPSPPSSPSSPPLIPYQSISKSVVLSPNSFAVWVPPRPPNLPPTKKCPIRLILTCTCPPPSSAPSPPCSHSPNTCRSAARRFSYSPSYHGGKTGALLLPRC